MFLLRPRGILFWRSFFKDSMVFLMGTEVVRALFDSIMESLYCYDSISLVVYASVLMTFQVLPFFFLSSPTSVVFLPLQRKPLRRRNSFRIPRFPERQILLVWKLRTPNPSTRYQFQSGSAEPGTIENRAHQTPSQAPQNQTRPDLVTGLRILKEPDWKTGLKIVRND